MEFEIVEVTMCGKPARFKYGLLAARRVSKQFGFANAERDPVGFLFEFSYHAYHKPEKLKKYSLEEFEEDFDTVSPEDVQKLSEALYKSMEDMGKILAPARGAAAQGETETKEEQEEEMTK